MVRAGFTFFFVLILVAAFCVRCNRSEDQARPSFTFTTEHSFSNDTIFIDASEPFSFELDLSDDKELHSLRVFTSQSSDNIDFSCSIEPEFFEVVSIQDLEGEQAFYEGQVQLPDSISGNFSTAIQVLDGAGNTASENYTIVMSNASLPRIDSMVFVPADSSCILTDLEPLAEISVSIYARNSAGISLLKAYWMLSNELIISEEISLSGEPELNELVQITVPDLVATETWTLKLELMSSAGISAWAEYQVE